MQVHWNEYYTYKFHIFPLLYFILTFLALSCSIEIENSLFKTRSFNNVNFYNVKKQEVFWRFQGVQKRVIRVKLIKSLCFLFLYIVVLCAIGYHLHNLKNAKDTHGRKLLSVKTQDKACNVTKSNTLSWVFSTFLNCTNGTNLRKASHIFSKRKHLKDCEECFLFYQKSYFFLEIFKFCTFLFPSLWT